MSWSRFCSNWLRHSCVICPLSCCLTPYLYFTRAFIVSYLQIIMWPLTYQANSGKLFIKNLYFLVNFPRPPSRVLMTSKNFSPCFITVSKISWLELRVAQSIILNSSSFLLWWFYWFIPWHEPDPDKMCFMNPHIFIQLLKYLEKMRFIFGSGNRLQQILFFYLQSFSIFTTFITFVMNVFFTTTLKNILVSFWNF